MTQIFNSSNAKIVRQIHEWFEEDMKHLKSWRVQAREDFKIYAGDQWEHADEQYLRDNNRPKVTFNRTAPTIDAVTGAERANRQEVSYLPRGLEDGGLAEGYNAAARWIRDESDAEDEESEAFFDSLVCGVGCTDTWIDFEASPLGTTKIERISPLETLWDKDATKRNLSDARRVYRIKILDRATIKELWPDKRIDFSEGFHFDETREPHDQELARDYVIDQSGAIEEADEHPVVQCQWWERRPIWRVTNPRGETIVVDKAGFDELKTEIPDIEQFSIRLNRKEYFQAFVVGKTLLFKSRLHPNPNQIIPGFTLKFITGKRDEEEGEWFGIVKAMIDPQRWTNKFFSSMIDIFNSSAKGGLLAEEGAFANWREAEENWAKPDRIIKVADGALSGKRIQERASSQFPTALTNMLQVVLGLTRDVSGVNVEMLGLAGRTQSGVVERTRIQQSTITLMIFFDSLRRYRKEQGRTLLHFIDTYLDDKTMVRVVGEERFVEFKKAQQPSATKFDIIVDESPTSPNLKEEVWTGLQQILPALLRANIPMPLTLLDYLPVPQSVIARIKKEIAEREPSDAEKQAQQQAMLLQIEQLAADVDKTKAQALSELAKAFSNVEAREGDKQNRLLEFMKFLADEAARPEELQIEQEKARKSNERSSGSS